MPLKIRHTYFLAFLRSSSLRCDNICSLSDELLENLHPSIPALTTFSSELYKKDKIEI